MFFLVISVCAEAESSPLRTSLNRYEIHLLSCSLFFEFSEWYVGCQTLDRNGGGGYGRPIDFGLRDIGPLVYLGSGSYEVVDCDLYASWNLFYSDLGASAAFGLIANNRLRSANAAHWFDNIRQGNYSLTLTNIGGF